MLRINLRGIVIIAWGILARLCGVLRLRLGTVELVCGHDLMLEWEGGRGVRGSIYICVWGDPPLSSHTARKGGIHCIRQYSTHTTAQRGPQCCIAATRQPQPPPIHAPFRRTTPTGSACSSVPRSATSSPPPHPWGPATTSLSTALSACETPALEQDTLTEPLAPVLARKHIVPLAGRIHLASGGDVKYFALDSDVDRLGRVRAVVLGELSGRDGVILQHQLLRSRVL